MINVGIDISNAKPFITSEEMSVINGEIIAHHRDLVSGTGKGSDFLGWLRLPSGIENDLITRIKEDAQEVRNLADVFVVIGIGGSYLGARAVIESLSNNFSAMMPDNGTPHILYAGNNLCSGYHADLLDVLSENSYSVAVISKSGTTTEPAIAFRLIKDHLEKKYGKQNIAGRIIAITDAHKGALKQMADIEGYKTYIIPDDVGGRYSVLTPVGLLPVAVAGYDIEKIVAGAREMQAFLISDTSPASNLAMIYTAYRNALYRKGKKIELLVNYQPCLFYFCEWWKQLFGESEGKEHKGIFPTSAGFTTDLHSLGQYIQEGVRDIFETVISVGNPSRELEIPRDEEDADELNYIAGWNMSEVNSKAEQGTTMAHVEGGVPNIRITIPRVNEETLGQLIYFFEFSCALSGYTLGVNPFDQPGVEAYKRKMFALLGKKGY